MPNATYDVTAAVNFARDFGNDVGRDIANEIQKHAQPGGLLDSDAMKQAVASVFAARQPEGSHEPNNSLLGSSLRDFANGDFQTPQEILRELRNRSYSCT